MEECKVAGGELGRMISDYGGLCLQCRLLNLLSAFTRDV